MLIVNFSRIRVLPVGVVIDELGEVRVSENRVYALAVLRDIEQVGLMACERSFGGHSATLLISCDRPKKEKVLGTHEGEVVERGECDVDEEGVEKACETSKDDRAD